MRPADTTPHYKDGDTIYTAHAKPSLTQFSANNFISILYCDVYFKPYIYLYLYLYFSFDVLFNVFFKKNSLQNGHNRWPKHVGSLRRL
jgi:hypothetical protein